MLLTPPTRSARLARFMKETLASQVRMLVLALAVAAGLGLTGCWKPIGFFQQSPPPPTAPPTAPVAPAGTGNLQQQAEDTLNAYLTALSQDNGHTPEYDVAYAMVSRASQAKFTRAEFETKGRRGMPNFDIKSARTKIKQDTATITLSNPDEDAMTHEFHLVRESGQWKIVYLGGLPGMPFAE